MSRFLIVFLLPLVTSLGACHRAARVPPQSVKAVAAPNVPRPNCLDSRFANVVQVSCRSFSDQKWYLDYLSDLVIRKAAESTLAAGKTYFSKLEFKVLRVETSAPVCRQEVANKWAYALVAGMHAAVTSNETATTDCTTYGHSTSCKTKLPEPTRPLPEPNMKTVCEGGGEFYWMDTEESYEMLTDEEARLRSDPLIPPGKRPLNARGALTYLNEKANPPELQKAETKAPAVNVPGTSLNSQ